jgi:hypothetical protein
MKEDFSLLTFVDILSFIYAYLLSYFCHAALDEAASKMPSIKRGEGIYISKAILSNTPALDSTSTSEPCASSFLINSCLNVAEV